MTASITLNSMNVLTATGEEGKMEMFSSNIWWNDEDLKNALDVMGLPTTDENVERLADIMDEDETREGFEECQIAAGWDYMYNIIQERMFD